MPKGSDPKRPQRAKEPAPLPAPPGGPYLQMAFFCERVLTESDGVVSLIRQIDRLTTTASGPGVPGEMPPTTFTTFLAISLKSGEARGRRELRLIREQPSGLRDTHPIFSLSLLFEGLDRGVGLYGPVTMTFEQEGLYWFDLFVDDSLMTRMPFRVIYQRVSGGPRA